MLGECGEPIEVAGALHSIPGGLGTKGPAERFGFRRDCATIHWSEVTIMKARALAVLLLVCGLASPAAAESIASCRDVWALDGTDPTSTITEINQKATSIIAGLKDKGVAVEDITDWAGCVRADVKQPDGTTKLEFFDPETLQRLTTD
jgi:hypothetical protein